MKRLLLLSTILSLVYFTNAQTPAPATDASAESTLRLGLHITPTLGFIKSDIKSVKKAGVRLGYNWGLVFDIKFADNYFFATGINVVNTPVKFNVDTLDTKVPYVNADLTYKLQYIGIPLTLKLKTKEVHFTRYYGQFGVEPQFNISKKVNPTNLGSYGSDYVTPTKDMFNNFNADISFIRIAVVIGAGLEYSLGGKTALVGGLSYNGGFSDINKDTKSKITSSYVALNLGVLF